MTKGEFSTFAYKYIHNEIKNYWIHLGKKSFIPEEKIFSYDIQIQDDRSSEKYIDRCLSSIFNVEDIILNNIDCIKFFNSLKDKEQLIIKYLIRGFKQREIASILNKSQQAVSLNVKSIKKKWDKFFKN